MFMLPLFALLTAESTPFSPYPSLLQKSLYFGGTSTAIIYSGTQKVLLTPEERKHSIGPSLLTSFPSMTLTYLLFSIAPLAVDPLLTSLSLPPPALSCSWEGFQNLGSDHLPILLTISFGPIFRPNERPPSFNFQKAR